MKAAIVAVCLVLLSARSASAQTATPTATPTPTYSKTSAVTNQGVSGPQQPCATSTVMQAGSWYLVSATIACQPCVAVSGQAPDCPQTTQLNPNGVCDATAMWWSETVHGHVGFGPPSTGTAASAVRVQVYDGQSQGETVFCNANNGQVNCGSYGLGEDWISDVPSSTHTVQVPFDTGGTGPASWFPGDGDPFRVYVFAMPIGGSLTCTSNQYVTEEFSQEYF
jgi:hypothetical protein